MAQARNDSRPAPRGPGAIPRGIWALGFVSLLMDTSSELIHSLLPVFLVSVLGAGAISVGLIEGVAEATASVTKVFSGALSDRLGRRKVLVVIGYGLAALTKPLFPLASSPALVLAARFIDRIGKGIRGAPRDALIGDIAPPDLRGACYGLRQSLDTVGAFAGPILAIVFMGVFADDIPTVFWIATIPAFLSVVVLMLAVHEPERPRPRADGSAPIRCGALREVGAGYWRLVALGLVISLARFSVAFAVLRASAAGLAMGLVPLVFIVMNVVHAAAAYPAGSLSDRLDRRLVLALGLALLAAADLVLAVAPGIWTVMAGVVLWGLHMGLSEGLLAALVADTTPAELRGTAFGVFNLVTGLALLAGNLLAGLLWDMAGLVTTFVAGAALATLALTGVAALPAPQPASVPSPEAPEE